jgi:hypothetical protein
VLHTASEFLAFGWCLGTWCRSRQAPLRCAPANTGVQAALHARIAEIMEQHFPDTGLKDARALLQELA